MANINKRLIGRLFIYIIGIFLFALGVALAIKSDLGVSPVSSLPYVVSLITGASVGAMTVLLYTLFVGIQWMILGREFAPKEVLQLVFALAFGACVDITRALIQPIVVTHWMVQLICLILGTVLISFGIFLILKSMMTVSPTDGLVKAIAKRFRLDFPKVKISVDVAISLISAVLSFLMLGRIEGVGIGTIVSAIGVGSFINLFDAIVGEKVTSLLSVQA